MRTAFSVQMKLLLLCCTILLGVMGIAVASTNGSDLVLRPSSGGYKYTFSSLLVPRTTRCNYDTSGGFYCPDGKTKNWRYCKYCGTGRDSAGYRTAKRVDSFWSVDSLSRDCTPAGNLDTTLYYNCNYKLRLTYDYRYACGSCNNARLTQVVPAYLLVGDCKEKEKVVAFGKPRELNL